MAGLVVGKLELLMAKGMKETPAGIRAAAVASAALKPSAAVAPFSLLPDAGSGAKLRLIIGILQISVHALKLYDPPSTLNHY